jgi:hypothetical protein
MKRKLTQAELSKKVTLSDFIDYDCEVGEDFIDQTGLGNGFVFAGFLIHKYPSDSLEIINIMNASAKNVYIPSIQNIQQEYSKYQGEEGEFGHKLFYSDYAEFVNLTVKLKANVNKALRLQR